MSAADVVGKVADHMDWQRELYQHFHRHPEVSGHEHQTAERIEQELTQLGMEPFRVAQTGVVVILENGSGTTVLARADTDALPVMEATGLEYASENEGVMHACEHDVHIVSLLGTIRLLHENRNAWTGTYIGVFQPAEENGSASQSLLDDGIIAKIPQPDVAFPQHVMADEEGKVGITPGPALSAGDSLRITVFGRCAHGSMPHLSLDPVVLSASIVMRLQSVVSREVAPGTFAVVTVGAAHAGTSANIIADRAELLLNLRTYDTAVREKLITAIERIVRGECEAAGSPQEPTFEYYDQFPLTSNDAKTADRPRGAFTTTFGEDRVYRADPVTSSEDFSRLPDALGVPYAYWTIGSVESARYRAASEKGTVNQEIPANHSPFLCPADGSVPGDRNPSSADSGSGLPRRGRQLTPQPTIFHTIQLTRENHVCRQDQRHLGPRRTRP